MKLSSTFVLLSVLAFGGGQVLAAPLSFDLVARGADALLVSSSGTTTTSDGAGGAPHHQLQTLHHQPQLGGTLSDASATTPPFIAHALDTFQTEVPGAATEEISSAQVTGTAIAPAPAAVAGATGNVFEAAPPASVGGTVGRNPRGSSRFRPTSTFSADPIAVHR